MHPLKCHAALQAVIILVAMPSGKRSATKILAKVANWQPTDQKRNLLEKLSIIGQI